MRGSDLLFVLIRRSTTGIALFSLGRRRVGGGSTDRRRGLPGSTGFGSQVNLCLCFMGLCRGNYRAHVRGLVVGEGRVEGVDGRLFPSVRGSAEEVHDWCGLACRVFFLSLYFLSSWLSVAECCLGGLFCFVRYLVRRLDGFVGQRTVFLRSLGRLAGRLVLLLRFVRLRC